jgi:hypothetical protein
MPSRFSSSAMALQALCRYRRKFSRGHRISRMDHPEAGALAQARRKRRSSDTHAR